jgi:hypothetical protein
MALHAEADLACKAQIDQVAARERIQMVGRDAGAACLEGLF